jgi:hypothetical protein
MRNTRTGSALAAAVVGLGAIAAAQNVATRPAQQPAAATAPSVVGSHQIDRFEAIKELQAATRSNPRDVAGWIILGELAHEVALDLPPDQDDAYYKLSREAYEKALALEANNAGLKAAVQFARDQEAGAARFDEARKRAVPAYIAARRRELAATNLMPTVQVYTGPGGVGVNVQNLPRPRVPSRELPVASYGYPTYLPFATAEGTPYTYNQYLQGYTYQNPADAANAVTTPRRGSFPTGAAVPGDTPTAPNTSGAAVKPPAAAAPPR